MNKFDNIISLDEIRVLTEEIEKKYVQQVIGKALSDNNYTDSDMAEVDKIKNKADSINLKKLQNDIDENRSKWERDTIYNEATSASSGLLSSKDKVKLDAMQVLTKLSQLQNDENYQSKEEVQKLINNARHITKEVVSVLPEKLEAKENVIYLVPKESGDKPNIYNEYMFINGDFELLGDTATEIDLVDYVTNSDLSSALSRYIKTSDITFATEEDIKSLFV